MKKEEFGQAILELAEEFGARYFTEARLNQIWKHVADLPIEGFERIIEQILENERVAPVPSKYKEYAQAWRKRNPRRAFPPSNARTETFSCMDCMDSGVVLVRHNQIHVNMICDCSKKLSERESASWGVPIVDRDIVEVLPLYPDRYRDLIPKNGKAGLWQAADGWRERMAISKSYWENIENQ